MPATQTLLNFSEAERPLGERLLKLAAETDRVEGYREPHATEIARWAEQLGQRLGLHGVDLSALKFAALAHDLGERSMKRDYLLRPGSLTWEEQLDLWRHPIIGEQAAAELKLPRLTQLLIRWHHEWWNGQGYPDGLAGTAIPLGARILRVVDTYCALLANRPHRNNLEAPVVEQFIADQAGVETDPQVVKEFLALLAAERPVSVPVEPAAAFIPAEETAVPDYYTTAPTEAEAAELAAAPFVSVWDTARQEAERAPFGWQGLSAAEANERWPATHDSPTLIEDPADEAREETVEELKPTLPAVEMIVAEPLAEPFANARRYAPQRLVELLAAEPVAEPGTVNNEQSTTTATETSTPPAGPLTAVEVEDSFAMLDGPMLDGPMLDGPMLDGSMLGDTESSAAAAPTLFDHPENETAAATGPSEPALQPTLQIVTLSDAPDHFWPVAQWLYEEWWAIPGSTIHVVSDQLKEHLAGQPLPSTLVAIVDGQLAGSISLHEYANAERPDLTPCLAALYVRPELRQHGVASQLLAAAEARLRGLGALRLYFTVPEQADFFAKRGWQVLEPAMGAQTLIVLVKE